MRRLSITVHTVVSSSRVVCVCVVCLAWARERDGCPFFLLILLSFCVRATNANFPPRLFESISLIFITYLIRIYRASRVYRVLPAFTEGEY
jgi:hypothetical protein